MLRLVLKIDNGGVKGVGSFFFGFNKFQPGDTVAEITIYSLFFSVICSCNTVEMNMKLWFRYLFRPI